MSIIKNIKKWYQKTLQIYRDIYTEEHEFRNRHRRRVLNKQKHNRK